MGSIEAGLISAGIAVMVALSNPHHAPFALLACFLMLEVVLGLRVMRVSANVADGYVQVRNRWLTVSVPIGIVLDIEFRSLGGFGPNVVALRTRNRVRRVFWRRLVRLDASSTWGADTVNDTMERVRTWIQPRRDAG